jgi:DNA-binding transcriptional LysR family regulator
VSQHVQRLERDLGLPLVLRSPRGITLTEAGAKLLTHADALAARLSVADSDMRDLAALEAGTLKLVAFPSAAAVLVPPVLAALPATLDVRLSEAEPPEARQQVLAGEADLALVFDHGPAQVSDLVEVVLFEDELKAVVSARHRLASRKRVGLEELAGDRWIAGCPRCEAHLVRATAEAGFVPDVRHRTDDYVVVQRLVGEGLAVSLLPQLALTAATDPRVRVLAVKTAPTRRVGVVLRAELVGHPAVAAAVEQFRICKVPA